MASTQLKNNHGITSSKPIFQLVGTAIYSVVNIDSNKDGQVTTLEVLGAVQIVAFQVIKDVPNLKEFRKEAADYTEAEKEELIRDLVQTTNFAKAKLAVLFERGTKIVLDIIDFVIDARRPEEDFEPNNPDSLPVV